MLAAKTSAISWYPATVAWMFAPIGGAEHIHVS